MKCWPVHALTAVSHVAVLCLLPVPLFRGGALVYRARGLREPISPGNVPRY